MGFICFKKVGNVVVCNCVKWWMCEVVWVILFKKGYVGWDYVLIGCVDVIVVCFFEEFKCDFIYVLKKLYEICI